LTWHNLDFAVPKAKLKGNANETLLELDDPRAELLSRHSTIDRSSMHGGAQINVSRGASEISSASNSMRFSMKQPQTAKQGAGVDSSQPSIWTPPLVTEDVVNNNSMNIGKNEK
jgi:hypothetical protein